MIVVVANMIMMTRVNHPASSNNDNASESSSQGNDETESNPESMTDKGNESDQEDITTQEIKDDTS